MSINLTDPIQRIETIVKQGVFPGIRISDVMLLNEYARRVVQLEKEANVRLSGLFFDPMELENRNADKIISEVNSIAVVIRKMNDWFLESLLQNYLVWTRLVIARNSFAVLQPDLYEPLIRMLERKAVFTLHRGEAVFGNHRLPIADWRTRMYPKMDKLDDDSLSKFD